MTFDYLQFQSEDAIATITLNRPDQRNALNRVLRSEFKEVLDSRLDSIKVAVITGAGPSFCAGMDLKEPVGHGEGKDQWSFFKQLYNCNTIFIAALNGPVVGAGITLASACDLAIAEPTATFALPQITHGIYGGVAAAMLHLSIPKKVVAEMALTGLPISPERAASLGLINRVSAPGECRNEAMRLAKRIAGFDQGALDTAKYVIQNVPDDDASREAALKEVKLGQFLSRPLPEDRVIETRFNQQEEEEK